MNIAIIKGNMVRDPELRYTPSGTAIANFAVAVNESYTNRDNEKVEKVNFFDVTAWGKTAETIGQYFVKGKPILVQGKLSQESWEDKQTSQKKSKVKITLERFEFCGGDRTEGNAPRRGQAAAEAPQEDANYDQPAEGGAGESDDIPF